MARTEIRGGQITDATVSLTADVTGTLPAANGGTGNSTNTLNNVLLGNGTGALQTVAPGTSGNALKSNGTTWASAAMVKADVGLGNVDDTSDATKNAAAVTLTNKTMDSTSPTAFNPAGILQPYGGRTAPTGWLMCDGTTVSRATYSGLFAVLCESIGTFTVTIAAPAVVTRAAHGLVTGDQVYLTTTGALPTGLSQNTLYYVIWVSSSTFNLATTRANAVAGTKITTTGSQSGVHTLRWCPYGLGDGSTTFTLPDFRGRTIAGADAMGGTAAARLNLADALGSYGNVGAAGGEQRHTMTLTELVSHTHNLQSVGTSGAGTTGHTYAVATNLGLVATAAAGSTTPFNLISPTGVANVIIKT